METTGINKTVYRSDIISNLDSFTSVRNVLAWEMFQDGQVRNYDGVINDLQRLYPEVDFDSVTDNVDPESIAADEDAIYALVDNIINKLTEYGISKDNFNYAIWACDNPEDVADTYGVDIEDVSAYKITDGILLQDLGVEGQLYGVANYPEEDWDVIESALKGGNMKTREDYKDYYLEQLTERFGDMTERDYNSAKKFCYDEEWNLGEVGNMAEAIDGLGDAWTEYQKQYKEGFEIMNNIIKSAIDYSSLETVDVYDKAEREMLQVIEDLLKPYGADIHLSRRINGGIPEISVTAYFKNGWSLYTTLHGSSFNSSWFTVFHNKQTVAEKQYTFAAEKWKKDDSFRERDIKSLSTKLEYAIEQMKNHEYDVYANKHLYPNGLPEGVKAPPLKAFNEVTSSKKNIGSSRRNNMKIQSSASLSEGERDGISIVLGYITKAYGEEEDFTKYDVVRNSLSDEELKQLDDLLFYVIDDKQDYRTINKRILKDDIPLLNKVYNILDDNDLLEDWDAMSGFEKICLTSSKGDKNMKVIKSANGSWEYQEYDMDEVEEKIGDIGISFTEPLLLADDGTLYTRAGFDQWLKYLEREEGDNWPDAYEVYHRDTDEEFIEMCQDDFFQHDFGHTLTIYPEGLKSIAESVAEEIPSNEAPFAIPSGFAFNLYAEEEEPSGFNSYWIDDMSLNSESFIWGINPEFGNRFDVVIDPDYLWNGTENIQSGKKGEKKMKIQSKRLIKSGTSNFGSNDNVYGYDFPLVTYVAENYVYDEENDVDTEERDYDLDSLEYRDEIDNATDLATEMDIPLYDDYRDPDYAPPFCIKIRDGYYEGIWIEIKEGGNTEDLSDAEFDNLAAKINTYLDTLVKDYGWQKLGVTARFSNGETMYHKIDNSRESVTSGLTFRQAVQDFKAAGQWNDYYEMQQDWESYKDGLERDGVISEKTRSTWGNPCTPEAFKRWNK